MKSYKDIILFTLVIIGSAAAGIWVLNQNQQTPAPQQSEQSQSEAQNKIIDRIPYGEEEDEKAVTKEASASVEAQFEKMLNDFLNTLAIKARKYRQTRKAVNDIIKPENIRADEFLEENKIFAESIKLEMETQMDGIINSFDSADQEIKALVTAHPGVDDELILGKWNEVKNKRIENYMSFFLLEKDYVEKHIQILKLLSHSKGQFEVDVENNTISFANPKLEAHYQKQLEDIKNIEAQEELIFSSDEDIEKTKTTETTGKEEIKEVQPSAGADVKTLLENGNQNQ